MGNNINRGSFVNRGYAAIISGMKDSIVKSIAKIFSTQIISYVFQILSGIVIARTLGPEGKGQVAVVFSFVGAFVGFSQFGIPLSNVYYLNKGTNKNVLYSNTLLFSICVSLILIVAALVSLPYARETYFKGISPIYIYVSLSILLISNLRPHLLAFLRGLEEYGSFNGSSLVLNIGRFVLLLIFLSFFSLDVDLAILSFVIAGTLSVAYTFIAAGKHLKISRRFLDIKQFKKNLNFGLREYLGGVINKVNLNIDLLILAIFFPSGVIGVYSVAQALVNLLNFIPDSLGVVLVPLMVKLDDSNKSRVLKNSVSFNVLIYLICWVVFFFFGRLLIRFLYGESFVEAYQYVNILFIGALFLGLTKMFNKYFTSKGKPEIKSITRVIILPVKVLLMYFLIKYHGLVGAAWSWALTSFFLFVVTVGFYIYQKQIIKNNPDE